MALRYMSQKSGLTAVASAREIAEHYGIPFEITAKTLQRLKDTGIIQSAQGAKGGYTLQRSLASVSLAEFLVLMEGPQSVVACGTHELEHDQAGRKPGRDYNDKCGCEYQSHCGIRPVMADLNSRVYAFLSGIKLAELTRLPVSTPLYNELAQEP